MEIKATLSKPYTEEQRVNFIIEQNHNNGYEIRGEQPETLTAWGYTDSEILVTKKQAKHNENTTKAQQAIQDGYVVFKNAQFETNTQTCSDLTSTMLIMQAMSIASYNWLSKDDKVVTLTLADFQTLGSLIATYKNTVWNTKYIDFKTRITNAQTISELDAIVIDYDVPAILQLI